MRLWTKTEIVTKIENDLDLTDEDFISPAELLGYINQAISEAEAEILGIYEDYFLTSANLALVSGTSEYSLPAGIYASKIRGIVYDDGQRVFPIKRIREMNKFELLALANLVPTSQSVYQYIIKNSANSSASGVKIKLIPAAQETSSTNVTIWHIREANRLVDASDVCDIPEGIDFVFAKAKELCRTKENMGTPPPAAVAETKRQKDLMIQTLTNAVPDGESEVEMDVSIYQDMN